MQKFFLLFLTILFSSQIALSQETAAFKWQPVSKNQLLQKGFANDQNVPINNLFKVDFESLNQTLLNYDINDKSALIIDMPVLNGKTEKYELTNSSIMEAPLQNKYPKLRTFMLRSITDRSIQGRLAVTPEGLSAIIDIDGFEVLINKVSKKDNDHYAVFKLVDDLIGSDKLTPMACGAHIEDIPMVEPAAADALNIRGNEITMMHFRVGIATTSSFGEEIGSTSVEATLAKVVQVMNNVNLRYNKDHAMQLDLIANEDKLIYVPGTADFFTIQDNGGQLLGQSQAFFNQTILSNQYDYAQTWTERCSDVGGVVSGSACNNQSKARGVSCGPANVGYFLTTVKHEMGHQFSASHTFNACNGSDQIATQGAYEPGSGSTIMGYPGACASDNIQNNADDYFHVISILQVRNHHVNNPGCGTFGTEINHVPDIVLPTYSSSLLTIPADTPYELVGTATDMDGDNLLYGWEQFDPGSGEPLGTNFASGPLNRPYPPSAKGYYRIIPKINNIINDIFDIADRIPSATREMNWKLIARDYNPNAGGVGIADFKFKVDSNAGPFKFTFPAKNTDTIFELGQYVELKWDVANSDKAPVNCEAVNIYYSINGGTDFTDTLLLNTPNDGHEFVMLPVKAVNSRFKIKGAGSIFLDISRKALRVNEPAEAGYSYDVYPHNALLCPASPKEFTIKSISWKDYSTPVKVELVDGWPANTIISLNKSALAPGEDVILSIDTKDVNEAGFFTIKLRGISEGFDTLYRYVTVEILPSKLEFVSAVNPLPGTVNSPQVPTFGWAPIPGADQYVFELSSDSRFINIIDSYVGVQPNFNTLLVLAPGTIFYWRVRAINRCFEGPWSDYNTFQTILYECNTISALGLPKNISSNVTIPPVEIKFDISNQVGTTADINLKNINISHGDISKLEISAKSPSGKIVKVISERCSGISGMNTSFDDSSPLPISCGQIKADKTFQPGEPLSGFNGDPVQGDWSVTITTKKGGSSGVISSLDFELCASVTSSPIIKINNNVLKVKTGFAQTVENKDLKYESDQTTEDNIWYFLLSEPEHGYFTSYGQRLYKGDRFLQSFLNDWALEYVPFDDVYEGADEVTLLVRDNKFGYLAPEIFKIDLNKSNILKSNPKVNDVSNLIRLYPNPTKDLITIDMSDFKWSGNAKLNITDLSGKLILSRVLSSGTATVNIDLGQVASGVYFANIISGNYVAKQKLIKI